MYANADTVRTITKNIQGGVSDEEIAVFAALVDSNIDGALSARYYWPIDSQGNDIREGVIPPQVKAIAALLTAGQIENSRTSFATPTIGTEGMQHPYGSNLERQGKQMLKRLAEGPDVLAGVEARLPGRVQAAPPSYRPVSGFTSRYDKRNR